MINSFIPYECSIGESCKFLYGGIGSVIHKRAKIGDNVWIGTNVLIGGRSNQTGVPEIESNVYNSTGAKILGDIKIGDNYIMGVINDVKNNCSVGGVLAKLIKHNIIVENYCSLKTKKVWT